MVFLLQVFYLDILKEYGIMDSVFHMRILFVSYANIVFGCFKSRSDCISVFTFSASSPSPRVFFSSYWHQLDICCLSLSL